MRLSLTDSLKKKNMVLSAIGMIACTFLLFTGLFSLRLMDRIVGLEEAFHEHTMMHFQSLDHLLRYTYEGDEQDYVRFRELRLRCKGISEGFATATELLKTQSIDEIAGRLAPMMETVTVEDGKDYIIMAKRMGFHSKMKAMIQACVVSTDQEVILLDVAERYHSAGDAASRSTLRPEIELAIQELNKAKLSFATAIADLSHWSSAVIHKVFIGAFLLFLVVSMVLSYFMGRAIVNPILEAIRFAERVAKGGLERRLNLKTNDETRNLASAINAICDAVQILAKEAIKGAASLTESAQDLSATANQFAATATETSASVTEINVTARELQQAVQSSTENADSVASYAEHSAQIYEVGKSATEEMGVGMGRINREVVDVGERIANLSIQAIRIAEIIDMVDELAHQSELLSVNASIEAAKAGEFGRGFQVVAAEVKTLSEQSKGATKQVRSILKEIQKAAEAAAKAAEQSALSVQEGIELNKQASEAMAKLADSFSGAVAFTRKIAATSRQELVGVSQVTNALADIQGATQQNTAGARLMESRTRELVSLAEALKSMVAGIRV
ncbi:MAG: methyl-accepting chemotaxis protein [Desulfatibacillum sp.]|nr:methyl-accepting chemotaxis protein [Desulfatibacillum sp.]